MPGRLFRKKTAAMYLRYMILGILLGYITYIGIMHLQHQTEFPPVDAICPFGGLESLFAIIFQGKFLNRIFISSFILLGATILLVFVSGRSFCGWICPLGTLQGIFGSLGNKITKRRYPLSMEKDRKFRYLKYVILVVFVIGAWIGGKLLIRPYDPWVAWMHLAEGSEVLSEFFIGAIVLAVSLGASIAIPRFFCRYLCPMGIFLGILNRFSLFRLEKNEETCNHCRLCDQKCPVGIPIESMKIIDKAECLSCGECIPVCPFENTLEFKIRKKSVITPAFLGLGVIVLFFGSIGLTKAVGVYRSTPPAIDEILESRDILPEEIKGYMTLADVAAVFEIPIDTLYTRLDLDEQDVSPLTKCRDIKKYVSGEFETDSVRTVVRNIINAGTGCIDKPAEDVNSPHSIMGTHTLREVSLKFNIEIEILYGQLGIDTLTVPPNTPCRELKNIISPDFHTSKVREAVANILEIPY